MARIATRRSPGRWRRWLLAAFGVVLALAAPPVRADEADDLARLRQEAAQLRRSLDQLEARIQALENRANAPAARVPAPADASSLASLKQNWSQVRPGTPQDTVAALLGKPENVLRIDGSLVWYYVYPGMGRGSVFFTAGGKVSSVQAPAFGWSW